MTDAYPTIGDCFWLKLKGFPRWPAKVCDPKDGGKEVQSERKANKVLLHSFGDHMYIWASQDALAPFEGPMMGALGFDDAVADRLGIRWVISDDPNLRANLRRGLSNWLPGSQGYGGPHVPLPAGGVQQSARVPACDVVSLPEVSSRGPTRFRLRISGPAGERASECFLPGAGRGALAFRFEPPLEPGQVTLRLESDPPGASAIYSARPELGRLRVGDQQGPGSLTLLYARQLSAPYREHPRPWRGAWLSHS